MILEQKSTTKKPKVIMLTNGKLTQEWLSRKDTSRLTASLEATFFTVTIDLYERKDAMFLGLPTHSFRPTFHQRRMVKRG